MFRRKRSRLSRPWGNSTPDEQQRLCELADKDFGNLTDQEKEEAGALTGFLDLYDDKVHTLVRSVCEDVS